MSASQLPDGLLDLVEGRLRSNPSECAGGTGSAYLVEEDGSLSRIVFSHPQDDIERTAVAALLLKLALEGDAACVVVAPVSGGVRLDAHCLRSQGLASARRVIPSMAGGGMTPLRDGRAPDA